ncbi:DUF2059 domain-containing protein [Sphingomonas donggukensis]|uniref:DUF2059 domain-containing protein n=1 Tax=Sphingomonas donggukensis TaxID=2949093 RepID=A0ABY4TU22_9SPHN|nr:DUF2059 domain-containing protein [Sphingomonas donggukensis]URW75828.1 DUF2059 domain-containing protein [Sphingomonas donggukensis]
MIVLAMLLQAAAPAPAPAQRPAPTAEMARLGTEVARSGTFAKLAPLMVEQQTGELLRDTPGLTPADQAELRAIAKTTGAAGIERITGMMGVSYAGALSADDMRAIIAFNATDAARRYRAAEPNAMAIAVQSMGKLDFKGDVRRALCTKTGKGCAAGGK